MTVVRLTAIARGSIDPALVAFDGVVLARCGDAAYAETPQAMLEPFVRALAFAGVRAEPCAVDLAAPPGSLRARGVDLTPLPRGAVALDVVRLERIGLGRITRELLRPRMLGILPPSTGSRERCRQLIRGHVALFEWSRTVWGSRRALRSAPARRSLRPVVFSRTAADVPAGRITTAGTDVSRWLFG